MGLLSEGSPLTWEETEKYADHVRKHGIIQFVKLYHRLKDRQNDCLKWGDEVLINRLFPFLFAKVLKCIVLLTNCFICLYIFKTIINLSR